MNVSGGWGWGGGGEVGVCHFCNIPLYRGLMKKKSKCLKLVEALHSNDFYSSTRVAPYSAIANIFVTPFRVITNPVLCVC